MIEKLLLLFSICFLFSCSVGNRSLEPWIDYNHVSKLELGMSKDDIISNLGEPILVLGDSEYDNTIYVFYNYHIKRYKEFSGQGKSNTHDRNHHYERSTLLKFTFVDNSLTSWEEDKITLGMTRGGGSTKGSGSFFQYFSLLLNLVLFIKII